MNIHGLGVLIAFTSVLALVGCTNPEERYEAGYSDGTVVGYNEACSGGSRNIIEGDFDNDDYSRGYADGLRDGERDCREGR